MTNTIDTPDFASMDIGKLRQYASHLRVAIPKTATKKDIIEAISVKLAGRTTPVLADDSTKVKPGHAKILILEDPTPEASNFPVYLNCNGYVCTIPRGKEVIVPMRVVRTLQDATVVRMKQSMTVDQYGREVFKNTSVRVPSYPFQILEMTPGPEPLTPFEIAKEKTMGPRRRYRDMFGRWPRPRELTRAIEQKLISLEQGEELTEAAQASIEV